MLAALTTSDKIQLAIAVITGVAALTALAGLALSQANERRRSQPIVIAHEATERRFAREKNAMWVVEAYLTSEGGGPAFNVRFGVEFGGVRYPYRLSIDDPESGNVQRVVRSGDRRPSDGAWPILLTSLAIWGRAADSVAAGKPDSLDAGRVYWARYESTDGKTWETRNPGNRSAKLDIKRVRLPRFRDWRDTRHRQKAAEYDIEWERQALDELRQIRASAEAEASAEGIDDAGGATGGS